MKTVVEMAREAGLHCAVLLYIYGKESALCDSEIEELRRLEAFAALVRADEREAFVAKIQSEIDHAHLNELRLTPSFGKRQGEIAVRASSLDAALDAIRARGETK